jgi:thiol:disulfide interchange protein
MNGIPEIFPPAKEVIISMMNRPTPLFAWLLALLFAAGSVIAQPAFLQKHATLADAAFNYTALQPGQQAVAAIVLDINDGFHAQSHTPSEPTFIKFVAKVETDPALTIYEPIYPAGETHDYGDLGKLNVYTGRVIVFVPIQVKSDAAPGPMTFTGKLRYQVCDSQACYPPSSTPFKIETAIVAAGQPLETQKPELFKTFDPTIFSRLAPGAGGTTQPTTQPATQPSNGFATPAQTAATIDFFGFTFSLAKDAYGLALSIAFVVGILFNLVPCVLPVLPLKAIAFYEVSQHNRLRSLLLGFVFSAGVVALFGVLALLIIVQHRFQWGEQFSNPRFVWPLVVLLVLMAAGMFGAFTVNLPAGIYRFSPRHDTISGNFLFGVFTAILSTPCTAPMFAGVLIWAGLEPIWLGVTTMLMVGVGMASPYLLLSGLPELARKFPRTGPWSELIKQFMGFLLLAVAVYFAGGRIAHSREFLWAVFATVAAGCVFLVVRAAMFAASARAMSITVVIALLLSGSVFQFTRSLTRTDAAGTVGIAWQPYTSSALHDNRTAGNIVMVEFTANWCANCLELESRVFRDPAAARSLAEKHVVPLRADLTDSDAPGWDKLKELNPAGGIPLTAIYPVGSNDPIRLSSTYSLQNLIDALNKASVQ